MGKGLLSSVAVSWAKARPKNCQGYGGEGGAGRICLAPPPPAFTIPVLSAGGKLREPRGGREAMKVLPRAPDSPEFKSRPSLQDAWGALLTPDLPESCLLSWGMGRACLLGFPKDSVNNARRPAPVHV